MAYDLGNFALQELTECGVALRRLGERTPAAMVDVASDVARFLYESIHDRTTELPACALVRVYKTHLYSELDGDLRAFADASGPMAPTTAPARCLTLLGTAGDDPSWSDRRRSVGRQAMHLAGPDADRKAPMIARLVRQFGSTLAGAPAATDSADSGEDLLLEPMNPSYNVFHVEEAAGSPFVAAQESFIVAHGIRSVVGFGGVLPSGDVFATILFAKVHIPRATATLFKALALNVKMALLPYERRVFRA